METRPAHLQRHGPRTAGSGSQGDTGVLEHGGRGVALAEGTRSWDRKGSGSRKVVERR